VKYKLSEIVQPEEMHAYAKTYLLTQFLRVLAMAILSVSPSVPPSRPGGEPSPGEIETPDLHRMIAIRSLVSNEVILVPLGEIPLDSSNEGIKERGRLPPPLRNRYFTIIGSSSVLARHRLAAYHNKHCRRAFQWYQHR